MMLLAGSEALTFATRPVGVSSEPVLKAVNTLGVEHRALATVRVRAQAVRTPGLVLRLVERVHTGLIERPALVSSVLAAETTAVFRAFASALDRSLGLIGRINPAATGEGEQEQMQKLHGRTMHTGDDRVESDMSRILNNPMISARKALESRRTPCLTNST